MLLIKKTFPPQTLIAYNHRLRTATSNPFYEDGINCLSVSAVEITELKQKLETEQRGLCCYCMQIVTHKNCIVEHFLPQKMFPEYQTDYYNLHLSCTYSSGKAKSQQYCDVNKGNELIAKLMSYELANGEKCQDLFQYDATDGSILPNDLKRKTQAEFIRDFLALKPIQREVLNAIEVLNLNAIDLKTKRLRYIEEKLAEISQLDKTLLETKKTFYETAMKERFAGIALYFINERLKRLGN
jgi:uncharacterized protein (TIGR02646 family)